MSLMVSISGIRGVFGESLNPENLARFTAAFGTWTGPGKIVVGRDSRVTGELCERVITAALQSVGCDVILLGITPTPTVAMGVLKHKAKGGIIISASHNPAQWNAIKMVNSKSEFLNFKEGNKVIEISESGKIGYQPYDKIGSVSTDEKMLEDHVDEVLALPYIDQKTIADAGFSVAVDAVNGAGSESIPYLLERLGVKKITKLHCTPNGIFPHNPEPLPENVTEICELIKKEPHDLGVVVDPDADRLALIDNNGRLFGEEYTQAAAFDFYLEKKRGDICTNLSSSMICDHIADKYGVTCHRSAVGEINVVEKMRETGSVISGEGNGGVINPDLHSGRDALVGIAMVLQMLAERKITSSEYRSSLPDYHIVKNRVELTDDMDADQILNLIAHKFAQFDPDVTDGVKIVFDESWVHMRKSNTEPIVRIYSEGKSPELAQDAAKDVIRFF